MNILVGRSRQQTRSKLTVGVGAEDESHGLRPRTEDHRPGGFHIRRIVSQSGGGKSKVKVLVGWFPLRILALACRGLALAASFQGLSFVHEPLCSPPRVSKFPPLIRTVVG